MSTSTQRHATTLPPVPDKAPSQIHHPDDADFGLFLQLMLAREADLRNTELMKAFFTQNTSEGDVNEIDKEKYAAEKASVLKRIGSASILHFGLRPPHDIISGISEAYEAEAAYAERNFMYAKTCFEIKTEAANRHLMVTACNTKGGSGKTPLMTHLAVIFAWITTAATLFVEANENVGTADMRLGLRRGRVLLPAAIKNHSLVADHASACRNLGKHFQTSLYALLSDPDDDKNGFSLTEYLTMSSVINKVYASAFTDPGNGFKRANEGAYLESDVVLHPVVAEDVSTYATLLTTMHNLHDMGHQAKLQKHSLIVMNGTKSYHTIEGFLKKIHEIAVEMTTDKWNPETQQYENSVGTNDPDQFLRDIGFVYDKEGNLTGEKIFMVPHSQWIKDGKPVSVLPEETGLETLIAYAKILLACLRLTAQTTEEKQHEIERRLRVRGELQSNQTITPASKEAKQKQLRDELIRLSGGDGDKAAQGLLEQYLQVPRSVVHQ